MHIKKLNEHSQLFRMILYHPMETGERKNYKTGEYIPENYISDLQISVDGEELVDYTWSKNVSKDPYFSFVITRPILTGQTLRFQFQDNHNNETNFEVVAEFDEHESFSYRNFEIK